MRLGLSDVPHSIHRADCAGGRVSLAYDAVISGAEGFEAERAFVTTGMLNAQLMRKAADKYELGGEDFSSPLYGKIFQMLSAFATTDQPLNLDEVWAYCDAQGLPVDPQSRFNLRAEAVDADTGELPAPAAGVADWWIRQKKATELHRQSSEPVAPRASAFRTADRRHGQPSTK